MFRLSSLRKISVLCPLHRVEAAGPKIFLLIAALRFLPVYAGETEHSISVEAGVPQIKEAENLGMVFTGPEIRLGYRMEKSFNRLGVYYSPDLSLACIFSHSVTGYSIGFSPVTAGVGYMLIDSASHSLTAGVETGLRYHWQMYPDLHNAQLFAQSEIPLDLILRYSLRWRGNVLTVNLCNSIFGFTGQLPLHDPYVYSLSFSEFAFKPLENLRFGSFGSYNHTKASINWRPRTLEKHTFGIGVEYNGLQGYKSLSYSLIWCKKF